MSVRGGPAIVINGLVLDLDAATTKSIVSGGTTWTDLARGATGVLSGGAFWSGLNGGCVSFNSVGARTQVGPSGLYAFGTGEFAMEMWVLPATLSSNYNAFDMRQQTVALEPCPVLYVSAGKPAFYFNGINSIGPTNVTASAWNQLVGTRTGGVISLYLNAALQLTVANTAAFSAAGCWLGGSPGDNSADLKGALSIVRIYSGVGLTQPQVLSNYTAVRGRFGQ